MKLRQSLVNLSQLMMSLPNNMHAMLSLIYNIKGWLTNKVYKFYGKEIIIRWSQQELSNSIWAINYENLEFSINL